MRKKNQANRFAGRGLSHLATRIFHTPLLLRPEKIDAIMSVFGASLQAQPLVVAPRADWFDDDEDYEEDGEQATANAEDADAPDVLVIPVHGTLVKRSSWMDADSGLVSYAKIQQQMTAALADPNCTGIVLDVDSPGGESAGMFDLAEWMYTMRGSKPIVAVANDQAYSAGYCTASCADKLLVTSVGGTGSIGCWMLHSDQSQYDKELGVKYTYVYAGAKKVDGNPHAPLSEGALADWQLDCDRVRTMFVQAVSRNRGVASDALYATEAGCFMGADSIPLLADGVGTLADAVEMCRDMAATAKRSSVLVPEDRSAHKPVMQRGNGARNRGLDAQALAEVFAAFRSPCNSGWADYQFANGGPIFALRRYGTLSLAETPGNAKSKISGRLAPYNSLSCDLGTFKEVFEPGCFTESLASGEDFRVLFNHNVDHVLGRRSAGTARFWDEADGLHYEADLPDTQVARDLKALMQRGDIKESSAAFYITKHRWETRSGVRTRVIETAQLVEGSPHSFAAYEATTAEVKPVQDVAAQQAAALADAQEIEDLVVQLQILKAA